MSNCEALNIHFDIQLSILSSVHSIAIYLDNYITVHSSLVKFDFRHEFWLVCNIVLLWWGSQLACWECGMAGAMPLAFRGMTALFASKILQSDLFLINSYMICRALTASNIRTIVQIPRLMAASNIHVYKIKITIPSTVRIRSQPYKTSPLLLRLILMMNQRHQLREQLARYVSTLSL